MIDIKQAIVYDIETFPNAFTLNAQGLFTEFDSTWEISQYRDDRPYLFEFFDYLVRTQTAMIGFNTIKFDYPVLHHLYKNPTISVDEIYRFAMECINDHSPFGVHSVWQSDRFAPQIDLFKINHFDNRAKTTSLKALQFNMRSPTLVDMPLEVGTHLNHNEVGGILIPYNIHDTVETKRFAHFCMDAINFRIGLMATIKGDILNFNDTKIGEQLLIQRIGEDLCYDKSSGRRTPRQTPRNRIALNDIIFPYIRFEHPEFNRVLTWLKQQTLTPADLNDPDAPVETKGVFKGIVANVNGIEFKFGTGGMHASVKPQRFVADDTWALDDVDVAGFYPDTAIKNKLAPAHLGEAYVIEYGRLPVERKEWQKKKGKKCVEANGLKLAGNGVYGKSNSPHSPFYDPQYTMTVTINCQLLICMLADWLIKVPTVQIIQANTDGITYRIQRQYRDQAREVWKRWEQYTLLTLEDVSYNRMWIRDVNNYVAESFDKNGNRELKQKGAYWHPDPLNYAKSISEAQPPAWHKDLGNTISIRAAVIAMVHGIDPDVTIRMHTDKFDFMLRAKVNRGDKLMLGETEIQRTSRYYVARTGQTLRKVSPPTGRLGSYKKANGVDDNEYYRVMRETGGEWDARVCTKNKSVHTMRESQFEAGFVVAECNDASTFDFNNINYDYYVNEARKLII